MNIYLLCLRKEQSRGLQAENAIFNAAYNFGLKKENCESFYNIRAFFRRLTEIFDENSLIILSADTEMFADTKHMLCSSFFLNCPLSDTLSGTNTDNSIPEEATLLPTSDGVFSGFAMKKDKNSVILLPLDDERTPQCLGDAFIHFMSETTGINSCKPENSDNDMNFTMALISEKAADTCDILAEKGLTSALSLSSAGDKLCRVLPDMPQISFFSSSLQRKNASPKNYAAVLAREAAEHTGTNIGASITNVFKVHNNGETQFFVYIAVADSNGAKVKKVYAQPGESTLTLIVCALDTVLEMIRDEAVIYNIDNKKGVAPSGSYIKSANRKKMLQYTIGAGTAALFLCISIGIGALIMKPDTIPASSKAETSKNESGTNDKSDFDYQSFWESLFNNGSDDDSTDDSSIIDEPANDDIHTGDSSEGETTPPPSTPEQSTDSSESETISESRPTQPPTEKPTDETEPTESGTEDTSESTQEPSSEPSTETQPTEPIELAVPEDSTAAAENQSYAE